MKIIALKGANSTGKSTTLNLVYDALMSTPGNKSTPKKTLGNPIHRDFECTVTQTNGTKIGFYTMGDYSGHTLKAIDIFQQLNVDILVLATNAKFKKPTLRIGMFLGSHILQKSVAHPKNKANNIAENQKDCSAVIALL